MMDLSAQDFLPILMILVRMPPALMIIQPTITPQEFINSGNGYAGQKTWRLSTMKKLLTTNDAYLNNLFFKLRIGS